MRMPFAAIPLAAPRAAMLFDIESGSVAAAVISQHASEPVTILASKRILLTNEDRTGSQLDSAVMQALSAAGKNALDAYAASAHQRHHGPIREIHVTLHAPWVRSATRDAQITLDKPTRITGAAIERAGKEALQDAPNETGDRTLFERSVVRVELNGYPTAEPAGKIASDIRVIILESSVPAAFLASMNDALAKLLPGHAPLYHSAIQAYTTVVRRLAAHDSSYTFLDIGNEATAASVIRSGSIMQQGTAPAGTRALIENAAEAGGETIESIYSIIRMIAEGTCDDARCESFANALNAAEPAYLRAVGEALSAMITESRLPNQLVIAIDPDLALWAERFFERLDFGQFTLTGKPFAVQVLSADVLAGLARFSADAAPDTGIAILAALVHIRYA